MTPPVPVAVGTGLDHQGAHLSDHVRPSPVATHDPRNHALTVHHPELAYPPPTDTDDLTTTAPSALHHDHDQLTTATTTATNHVHDQLTTTATTAHSTATNHDLNPLRHWHPSVPFPRAAVTGAAEATRAASC